MDFLQGYCWRERQIIQHVWNHKPVMAKNCFPVESVNWRMIIVLSSSTKEASHSNTQGYVYIFCWHWLCFIFSFETSRSRTTVPFYFIISFPGHISGIQKNEINIWRRNHCVDYTAFNVFTAILTQWSRCNLFLWLFPACHVMSSVSWFRSGP